MGKNVLEPSPRLLLEDNFMRSDEEGAAAAQVDDSVRDDLTLKELGPLNFAKDPAQAAEDDD